MDAGVLARALEWMDFDLSDAYGSEVFGLFCVDASGSVGFVNPMAAKMTGVLAWELIGLPIKNLLRFNHPEPNFQGPLDRLETVKTVEPFISTVKIADSSLLCVTTPILDELSHWTGTLVRIWPIEDPLILELLNQIIVLNQEALHLHQEKSELGNLVNQADGKEKITLARMMQDVELMESNIRKLLSLFLMGSKLAHSSKAQLN